MFFLTRKQNASLSPTDVSFSRASALGVALDVRARISDVAAGATEKASEAGARPIGEEEDARVLLIRLGLESFIRRSSRSPPRDVQNLDAVRIFAAVLLSLLERRLEAERADDAAGHGVERDHLRLELLLREHGQRRGEVLSGGGEQNGFARLAGLRVARREDLRGAARRERVPEPAGHVLVLGVLRV